MLRQWMSRLVEAIKGYECKERIERMMERGISREIVKHDILKGKLLNIIRMRNLVQRHCL